MNHWMRLLLALLSCLLLGGCLVTTSGTRVIRKDEQRQSVAFESDQGLLDFNTALRQRDSAGARHRGRSSFNIPFIISANSRHVLGRSAYFNDQVRIADVDADGVLSDAEVFAYVGP